MVSSPWFLSVKGFRNHPHAARLELLSEMSSSRLQSRGLSDITASAAMGSCERASEWQQALKLLTSHLGTITCDWLRNPRVFFLVRTQETIAETILSCPNPTFSPFGFPSLSFLVQVPKGKPYVSGSFGQLSIPFVGISRGSIIPGLLRWCEMDFVHPQSASFLRLV